MIVARLDHLAQGHIGDIQPVGDGVIERLVHYGPGYRIYVRKQAGIVIILLRGGAKSTQAKDIEAGELTL